MAFWRGTPRRAALLLGTSPPPRRPGALDRMKPRALRRARCSPLPGARAATRTLTPPPCAAVVLGVLLAGPPEAGAFVPAPVDAGCWLLRRGAIASAAVGAQPRGPGVGGAVVASRRAGGLRETVALRGAREDDGAHATAEHGEALTDEWTAEITGDEKFDTAWMAAWRNKDRIPCPFFKRRATDVLEAALGVGRFILARHKSLLVFAPRSKGGAKVTGLAPEAVLEVIRNDFQDRRYYITGQLTREVYSDVSLMSVSVTCVERPPHLWQPRVRPARG